MIYLWSNNGDLPSPFTLFEFLNRSVSVNISDQVHYAGKCIFTQVFVINFVGYREKLGIRLISLVSKTHIG